MATRSEINTPHRFRIIPQRICKRIRKHPLLNSLYLTEIGYEADTLFHPVAKGGDKNRYLLVYVAAGEGAYTVNKKLFTVSENDFFVLPAWRAEGLASSEKNPWSIYWAYFSGTNASRIAKYLAGDGYVPRKAKPLVGRVAQFNDILHHLELMENIENLVYANSRFYNFLCSFRLQVLSTRKHGKTDGVIQSIEYMRENISNAITLEDLAEVAGLSVSHYCALFKQKTGQTPMQLFTSLRIQRACQLLQNRNQTIKAVAYGLGFFDQYHFSRTFRQIMGVSPKDFRKNRS